MVDAASERDGGDAEDRAAERDALRRRVVLLEPGVILCREMPVMTKFTIDVLFERERELAGAKGFHIIVDLTETHEPDAEIRAYLKKKIASLFDGDFHMALVTRKNHLMNISVKFVVGKLGRSVKMYDTIEQALEGIHRERGEV
jgi:hypothetical protein